MSMIGVVSISFRAAVPAAGRGTGGAGVSILQAARIRQVRVSGGRDFIFNVVQAKKGRSSGGLDLRARMGNYQIEPHQEGF